MTEQYKDVFDFLPALYPIVHRTLKECGLDGPRFFVLSYARHFGRSTVAGHGVILADLERIVQECFDLDKSSASRRITDLANADYLQKVSISKAERAKHFPASGEDRSQNTLVKLLDRGSRALDRVNEETVQLIESLIADSKVERVAVHGALRVLSHVLPSLLQRVEQLKRGNNG